MLVTKFLESILEETFRVLKVQTLGQEAARTAHLVQPFGEDANPIAWQPIYADTENAEQPIIIGFVNPTALDEVGPGEKQIFSTIEDGTEKSFLLHLKNDNTFIIGSEGDFAVRYNELEAGFNQLKEDFNGLVEVVNANADTFASHTHPGVIVQVTGGSGAPAVGVPGNTQPTTEMPEQGEATEATIENAKIEEIKVLPFEE